MFLGQHFWARGYIFNTVGKVMEEIIHSYNECHQDKSFDDTFALEKDEK
jgi:REP element-mobilizing transposase RayT